MSEKIHIPESEYVQLIRHIKELEAQLKLAQGTLRKWKIVIADYKAQLADKDRLLLTAFQDAKKGVVQMTRKYDGWLTYLAAIGESRNDT